MEKEDNTFLKITGWESQDSGHMSFLFEAGNMGIFFKFAKRTHLFESNIDKESTIKLYNFLHAILNKGSMVIEAGQKLI